ncbi:MAG: GNAT family N-acetyltransferase, partial [Polymorphobacter sp.]
MTITCRTATPADAALLSALGTATFVETFGALYSAANLEKFLVNHSAEHWAHELADPAFAVRLAFDGNRAIGYAKFGPPHLPFVPEPGRAAGELRQLYVLAGWHGSGIAGTLTDWLIARARAHGVQDLYLSVFTQNPRAQAFYRRYGFFEVGRYQFLVGDHADEDLVMRCKLDDELRAFHHRRHPSR